MSESIIMEGEMGWDIKRKKTLLLLSKGNIIR